MTRSHFKYGERKRIAPLHVLTPENVQPRYTFPRAKTYSPTIRFCERNVQPGCHKRTAPLYMKRTAPLYPNPMNEPYEEPYDSFDHRQHLMQRKKEARQRKDKIRCK